MKKPYEAYIKVLVRPDTIGDGYAVSVEIKGGAIVRVPLAEIVMAPDIQKGDSIASVEELAALRRELDEARTARAGAVDLAEHWKECAFVRGVRLSYLAGALDAAQAFTGHELPARAISDLLD